VHSGAVVLAPPVSMTDPWKLSAGSVNGGYVSSPPGEAGLRGLTSPFAMDCIRGGVALSCYTLSCMFLPPEVHRQKHMLGMWRVLVQFGDWSLALFTGYARTQRAVFHFGFK